MNVSVGFALLLLTIVRCQLDAACLPWGLRLAYGEYYTPQGGANQIYVSFNTYGNCSNSYVGFGNVATYNQFNCTTAFLNFTWAPPPYFNCTVYTCAVSGIDYTKPILYTVYSVDAAGVVAPYLNKNFTTMLRDVNVIDPCIQTELPVQFLVYGDWSYYNSSQYPLPPITNCFNLLKGYHLQEIQGIIFTGDQAYNMNSNNGTNYVQLLTMLEPFSSVWPFIPVPGNHQSQQNTNIYVYNTTYYAPNCNVQQNYYAFKMGPVTFVSFDPESIVYNESDNQTTMQFLLTNLNQTIGSANTTFVIPYSHYPFVCSDQTVTPNCSTLNQSLYPILQLFYSYGSKIPVYFSGHVHSYQRQYPINLAGQVVNNNTQLYNNLTVPIMIIEGAGGTNYAYYTSTYPMLPFTAVENINTGFGMLNISNDYVNFQHIVASDCSQADAFLLTYIQYQVVSSFPVWAIVLLSIVGAAIVGVVIWFVWWKCRKPKQNPTDYNVFEVV